MSEKLFKDVFRGIQLPDKVDTYFDDVNVVGVTSVKSPDRLYIDIESSHLISRENVKQAESAVRLFVFGKYSKTKVVIRERYLLSGQYNLKNMLGIYRDSFLDELRETSSVEYSLVKEAKIESEGNTLTLSIEEGTMAKLRKPDIEKYFNKLFAERFGMNVQTVVKLIRPSIVDAQEKSKARKLAMAAGAEGEELSAAELDEAFAGITASESESMQKKRELEEKLVEAYDTESNEVVITPEMNINTNSKAEPDKKKDYKANAEQRFRKNNYNDMDCFYGKNVEGDIVEISTIVDESPMEVVVRGQVFGIESTEVKKKGTDKTLEIVSAYITDFTDTIGFKLFVSPDDLGPILEDMPEGCFVQMKATARYDSYAKDIVLSSVNGIKRINDIRSARKDEAEEKRVELHLHTQMSEMDAVLPVETAIQRAIDWGHHAIAITDHGVVQNFPSANKYLKGAKNAPEDFKILYGVEGYVVNDIKTLVMNSHGQSLDSEYTVFDIETTGLSFKFCKIIEIGAVRLDRAGNVISRFSEFINPEVPIPYSITKLTSITDAMVSKADTIDKVLPRFLEYCKDAILVADNIFKDGERHERKITKCQNYFNGTILYHRCRD